MSLRKYWMSAHSFHGWNFRINDARAIFTLHTTALNPVKQHLFSSTSEENTGKQSAGSNLMSVTSPDSLFTLNRQVYSF